MAERSTRLRPGSGGRRRLRDRDRASPTGRVGRCAIAGIDITELAGKVSFGNVWGLLVDNAFEPGLPPAEPFPLPVHTGDVRVDVQSALAQLAPVWGFRPLLDITPTQARDDLARASVMALSFVAQSARGQGQPMVPQSLVDNAAHDRRAVHDPLARRARPAARRGGRRLLDLGGRARHERLDLHRPGHRLDRRRRRRLPVRRGRRDERAAARRRPVAGAAHDRGRRADSATRRRTSGACSTAASG